MFKIYTTQKTEAGDSVQEQFPRVHKEVTTWERVNEKKGNGASGSLPVDFGNMDMTPGEGSNTAV